MVCSGVTSRQRSLALMTRQKQPQDSGKRAVGTESLWHRAYRGILFHQSPSLYTLLLGARLLLLRTEVSDYGDFQVPAAQATAVIGGYSTETHLPHELNQPVGAARSWEWLFQRP